MNQDSQDKRTTTKSPLLYSSRFSQSRKVEYELKEDKKLEDENEEKQVKDQNEGGSILKKAKFEVLSKNFDKKLYKKGITELIIESNANNVIKKSIDLEQSPKVITTSNIGFIFKKKPISSRSPDKRDDNKESVKEGNERVIIPDEKGNENQDLSVNENFRNETIVQNNQTNNQLSSPENNITQSENSISNGEEGPEQIGKFENRKMIFYEPKLNKKKKNKFSYNNDKFKIDESFTNENERQNKFAEEKKSSTGMLNAGFTNGVRIQDFTGLKNNLKGIGVNADNTSQNNTFKAYMTSSLPKNFYSNNTNKIINDFKSDSISKYQRKGLRKISNVSEKSNKAEEGERMNLRHFQRKGLIVDESQSNPNNLPIDLIGQGIYVDAEIKEEDKEETNIEGTHNYLLPTFDNIPKNSSIFYNVYNKYSQRISDYILRNKETIKLFGSMKYTDKPPEFFLEERKEGRGFEVKQKNNLENQQHPESNVKNKDSSQIMENNKILLSPNEFTRGGIVDLTPLPSKPRKKMKSKTEKREFYEVERSAVAMRRYEYTHSLNFKKLNLIKEMYKLPEDEMHIAAVYIQRWWKKLRIKMRNSSSLKIQRIFRGHLTRNRLREITFIFFQIKGKLSYLDKLVRFKNLKTPFEKIKNLYSIDREDFNKNETKNLTILKKVVPTLVITKKTILPYLKYIILIQKCFRNLRNYRTFQKLRNLASNNVKIVHVEVEAPVQPKEEKTPTLINISEHLTPKFKHTIPALYSTKFNRTRHIVALISKIQRRWRKFKSNIEKKPAPKKLKLRPSKVSSEVVNTISSRSDNFIAESSSGIEVGKLKSRIRKSEVDSFDEQSSEVEAGKPKLKSRIRKSRLDSFEEEDNLEIIKKPVRKPLIINPPNIEKINKSDLLIKRVIIVQKLWRNIQNKMRENEKIDTRLIIKDRILQPLPIYYTKSNKPTLNKLIQIQRLVKEFLLKRANRNNNTHTPVESIKTKKVIAPFKCVKVIRRLHDLIKIIKIQKNFKKKLLARINEKPTEKIVKIKIPALYASKFTKSIPNSKIKKIQDLWKHRKNEIQENERLSNLVNTVQESKKLKSKPTTQSFKITKEYRSLYMLSKIIIIQKKFKQKLLSNKLRQAQAQAEVEEISNNQKEILRNAIRKDLINLAPVLITKEHQSNIIEEKVKIIQQNAKNNLKLSKPKLKKTVKNQIFIKSNNSQPILFTKEVRSNIVEDRVKFIQSKTKDHLKLKSKANSRKYEDSPIRREGFNITPVLITKDHKSNVLDEKVKVIQKKAKLRIKVKPKEKVNEEISKPKIILRPYTATKDRKSSVLDEKAKIIQANFKKRKTTLLAEEEFKTKLAENEMRENQYLLRKKRMNKNAIINRELNQFSYFTKTSKTQIPLIKLIILQKRIRNHLLHNKKKIGKTFTKPLLNKFTYFSKSLKFNLKKHADKIYNFLFMFKIRKQIQKSKIVKEFVKPILNSNVFSTKKVKFDMRKRAEKIRNALFIFNIRKQILRNKIKKPIIKPLALSTPLMITKDTQSTYHLHKIIPIQKKMKQFLFRLKTLKEIGKNKNKPRRLIKDTNYFLYTKNFKTQIPHQKLIYLQRKFRNFLTNLKNFKNKIKSKPKLTTSSYYTKGLKFNIRKYAEKIQNYLFLYKIRKQLQKNKVIKKCIKPAIQENAYSTKKVKFDMRSKAEKIKNALFIFNIRRQLLKSKNKKPVVKKSILPEMITKNYSTHFGVEALIPIQNRVRRFLNRIKILKQLNEKRQRQEEEMSIKNTPRVIEKSHNFIYMVKTLKTELPLVKIILLQKRARNFLSNLKSKKPKQLNKSDLNILAYLTKEEKTNYSEKYASKITKNLKDFSQNKLRIKMKERRIVMSQLIPPAYSKSIINSENLKKIIKIQRKARNFLVKRKPEPKYDHQKEYLMKRFFKSLFDDINGKQKDYFLHKYFRKFYENTRARSLPKNLISLPFYATVERKINPIHQANKIKKGFVRDYIKNHRIAKIEEILRKKSADEDDKKRLSLKRWRDVIEKEKEMITIFLARIHLKESYRFIDLLKKKEPEPEVKEEEKLPKVDMSDFIHKLKNRISTNVKETVIEKLKSNFQEDQLKQISKIYLKEMLNRRLNLEFGIFKEIKRRLNLIDLLYVVKQKVEKNTQEFAFMKLNQPSLNTHSNFMISNFKLSQMTIDNEAEESHYYKIIKRLRSILQAPDTSDSDVKDKEIASTHLELIFPPKLVRYLYSYKWWNTPERRHDEKILSQSNLFTSKADPKLINFIRYLIKKEKNTDVDTELIKKRLLRNIKKFNNSNIFAIFRNSDEIWYDIENSNLCKHCHCRKGESVYHDDEEGVSCNCDCHSRISEPEDVEENASARNIENYSSAHSKSLLRLKTGDDEEEEKKKQRNIRITVKKRTVDEEGEDDFDILGKIKLNPKSSKSKKVTNIFKSLAEKDKKKKEDEAETDRKRREQEEAQRQAELERKRRLAELEKLYRQKEEEDRQKRLLEEYNSNNTIKRDENKKLTIRGNTLASSTNVKPTDVKKPAFTASKLMGVQAMLRKKIGNKPQTLIVRDNFEEDVVKNLGSSIGEFYPSRKESSLKK